MTQEKKQLLLKVLCAMSPYGIMCDFVYNPGNPQKLLSVTPNEKYQIHLDSKEYKFGSGESYGPSDIKIEDCKPYLRPMSSMTEKEKEYIKNRWCYEDWDDIYDFLNHYKIDAGDAYTFTDWLNENKFDHRGLIPMELALEAPEGMYNN